MHYKLYAENGLVDTRLIEFIQHSQWPQSFKRCTFVAVNMLCLQSLGMQISDKDKNPQTTTWKIYRLMGFTCAGLNTLGHCDMCIRQ